MNYMYILLLLKMGLVAANLQKRSAAALELVESSNWISKFLGLVGIQNEKKYSFSELEGLKTEDETAEFSGIQQTPDHGTKGTLPTKPSIVEDFSPQTSQTFKPPSQSYQDSRPSQPFPSYPPNSIYPPNRPFQTYQPFQPNQPYTSNQPVLPNQPSQPNQFFPPNQPFRPNQPYQPSQLSPPALPYQPPQGPPSSQPYQPPQGSPPSQPYQPPFSQLNQLNVGPNIQSKSFNPTFNLPSMGKPLEPGTPSTLFPNAFSSINKTSPWDPLPPNKLPEPFPGIPNKAGTPVVPPVPSDYFIAQGVSLKGLGKPSVPKEECHSVNGKIGECLAPFDCGQEGGEPDGLCHQGFDASDHIRTCCHFPSFCGYETNKEVTYLKNLDYPKHTSSGADCILKVDLLPGICQVRLDFIELVMKPMMNGVCDPNNSLIIRSSEPASIIPVRRLCGTISEDVNDELSTDLPHLYVHVNTEESDFYDGPDFRPPNKDAAPTSLRLILKVKDFPSRWNIRVSQIQCDGANLQAPTGCAQYYNMNKGNISTFNFLDGQYLNNLRLTSCIKRDPTACAIEFNMRRFNVGVGVPGRLGYGLTCQDYLVVNGEKTALCGSISSPRRFIFPAVGPESISFYSDEEPCQQSGMGYDLEYIHHYDCRGLEFFKYPVVKASK